MYEPSEIGNIRPLPQFSFGWFNISSVPGFVAVIESNKSLFSICAVILYWLLSQFHVALFLAVLKLLTVCLDVPEDIWNIFPFGCCPLRFNVSASNVTFHFSFSSVISAWDEKLIALNARAKNELLIFFKIALPRFKFFNRQC